VSKSRRHWLWITPLVIVLTPALLFVYASWRYPLRTGAILIAVYQRLPSSVRNNAASWNLMNAYLRATVEDGQPLEAKRELRRHKRSDYLVVALGDSATAGENVDPVARWTFLLQNLMRYRLRKSVHVINSAISGEIAPLSLKRLDRDVLALKPNLVIVGYLINDGRIFGVGAEGQGQTMVNFDEFLSAMQTIVAKAREAGAAVLVFTCQPIQPGFFGFQHMD
jgi:lysophospholipase L1-like esterase